MQKIKLESLLFGYLKFYYLYMFNIQPNNYTQYCFPFPSYLINIQDNISLYSNLLTSLWEKSSSVKNIIEDTVISFLAVSYQQSYFGEVCIFIKYEIQKRKSFTIYSSFFIITKPMNFVPSFRVYVSS